MTIHSLYIFDRHCSCVYYQDWHRAKRPKPPAAGNSIPAVSSLVSLNNADTSTPKSGAFASPRNTLLSQTGVVIAVGEDSSATALLQATSGNQSAALPFDEEVKLVYGVVLSLRNMIKKLSGRDEQFVNYRTSTYKLHLYETISGYKFIMLSDPHADSLRFALRQIYVGPFLDYVVRNPLVPMDSRERGVDNEYFRTSVDRLVRSLSIFS